MRPRGWGPKVRGVYLTLGPFDLTVIVDAPDDEAPATFALASGMRVKISSLTMGVHGE
jgi:uncharacterized protein with GYD domain